MPTPKAVFYLHVNKKKRGPFSLEQIKKFLKAKKISFDTRILKAGSNNWIKIGDVIGFSNRKRVTPPPPPPKTQERKEWYLSDTGESKGPYRKDAVLSFIEEKSIGRATYAWREGMENWVELIDIDEFNDYFENTGPPEFIPTSEETVSNGDNEIKDYYEPPAEITRERKEAQYMKIHGAVRDKIMCLVQGFGSFRKRLFEKETVSNGDNEVKNYFEKKTVSNKEKKHKGNGLSEKKWYFYPSQDGGIKMPDNDLLQKGQNFLAAGKIPAALKIAKKITNKNDKNHHFWEFSAIAKAEWGDTKEAILDITCAINLAPDLAHLYYIRALLNESANTLGNS